MQLNKMASFAAALLTAGTLSAAVVSEKPATIKNADFTELKDGAPVGWAKTKDLVVTTGKAGDTTFITLKAEKDLGYPGIGQTILQAKDLPELKEGETYEFVLSYRQKSEGVEKRAFGCIGVFAKGKRVAYRDGKNFPGTSADWQDVTATLKLAKLPEGMDAVRITFYLNGPGAVSFSDMKFTVKVVNSAK